MHNITTFFNVLMNTSGKKKKNPIYMQTSVKKKCGTGGCTEPSKILSIIKDTIKSPQDQSVKQKTLNPKETWARQILPLMRPEH